jgi:plastocyanin domain-containing protein
MKIFGLMFAILTFTAAQAKTDAPPVYSMTVTEKGYEPSILKVKANTPFTIKITRKTNATCAREITIPSQKLKVDLPYNKEVSVAVGKLAKGEVKFGCAMDLMIGGVMNVE